MPKNPHDFQEISSALLGGQPEKMTPTRDSRRNFAKSQQTKIFGRQKGRCGKCHKKLEFALAEFDHIKPWELGGKTVVKNGQALCLDCHKKKTDEERVVKVEKGRPKKRVNLFDISLPQVKLPKGF